MTTTDCSISRPAPLIEWRRERRIAQLTYTDTDKVLPSASGLMGALLFVRAHPYHTLLAALTALVALEMWLARARLLPVGIKWTLGWLLFLSVVAWSVTT